MAKHKSIIHVLIAMLCVSFVTGCSPKPLKGTYILPEEFLSIPETSELPHEAETDEYIPCGVHIFIDNTKSMAGYIGIEDRGGIPLRRDDFSPEFMENIMIAIRRQFYQYNSVLHLLDIDGNNCLHWAEFPSEQIENYTESSFYTFNRYRGAKSAPILPYDGQGRKIGPNRQLSQGDDLKPNQINVIITDLEEQNLRNVDLATKIKDDILSVKDHSAYLFAFRCPYYGTAYDSENPDKNDMSGTFFNGIRPLYVVMTGPTGNLDGYAEQFQEALSERGITREEYHCTSYHPEEDIYQPVFEQVGFRDIITVESERYIAGVPKDAWTQKGVNLNLGAVEMDPVEALKLYNLEDNVFFYKWTRGISGSKRFLLHFLIPLSLNPEAAPNLEGSQIVYYINGSQDSDHSDEFKELDPISVWYLDFSDPAGAKESPDANEPDILPTYNWETLRKVQIPKYFTIQTRRVHPGETLYSFDEEIALNEEQGEGEEGPRQKLVTGQDGKEYIQISIESAVPVNSRFNTGAPEMPGGIILIKVPVYARLEGGEDTPEPEQDWVYLYDKGIAGGEVYNDLPVSKTNDFSAFYRLLFGSSKQKNISKEGNQAEKIATIQIAISGFNAAKQKEEK